MQIMAPRLPEESFAKERFAKQLPSFAKKGCYRSLKLQIKKTRVVNA